MAKKIVWTKRASNKFNKIIDYLEQEWGPNVTQNFVVKVYSIVDLISDQPDLGTVENQDGKIRGFLLTKHNRLFYRVTDKEIILLNFFDTRSGHKRQKFWKRSITYSSLTKPGFIDDPCYRSVVRYCRGHPVLTKWIWRMAAVEPAKWATVKAGKELYNGRQWGGCEELLSLLAHWRWVHPWCSHIRDFVSKYSKRPIASLSDKLTQCANDKLTYESLTSNESSCYCFLTNCYHRLFYAMDTIWCLIYK